MTRSFIKSLVISGVISLLLVVAGFLLGWKTALQFSNAFFWAGALLIIFGVLSIFCGYSMRSNFGVVYSQSSGNANILERTKQWIADTEQSYSFYILLLICGMEIMLLSVLIDLVF